MRMAPFIRDVALTLSPYGQYQSFVTPMTFFYKGGTRLRRNIAPGCAIAVWCLSCATQS